MDCNIVGRFKGENDERQRVDSIQKNRYKASGRLR